MKFKGYGSVFNPAKKRIIVNFRKTPEYETDNHEEIRLLRLSGYITEEIGSVEPESKGSLTEESGDMTKKQVMEALDFNGTAYNPRDKKEVLYNLLEA